MKLHPTRFGFAIGITVAIIYTACITVSLCLGNEAIAEYIGYLAHGFDLSALVKNTPLQFGDALIGIAEWFVIGWLIGSLIAVVYNASMKTSRT
jgi:hypothetical protein